MKTHCVSACEEDRPDPVFMKLKTQNNYDTAYHTNNYYNCGKYQEGRQQGHRAIMGAISSSQEATKTSLGDGISKHLKDE